MIAEIGWAPVVKGPYRVGRGEPAVVVTCAICQVSQVFLDRPVDHEQIREYWTQADGWWVHRHCLKQRRARASVHPSFVGFGWPGHCNVPGGGER